MRILFITHDASLTGAPILLLRLLKFIKQKDLFPFTTVIRRDGPLTPNFSQLSETYVCPYRYDAPFKGKGIFSSIGNRLAYIIARKKFKRNLNRVLANVDVVFMNSIASTDMLPYLSSFRGKVISYLHELEFAISYFSDPRDTQLLMQRADLFLAPCVAVKENLIRQFKLPEQKIMLLNYLIDSNPVAPADIRKMTGVSPDTFIICGCGTTDWRKGFDLFHQVARLLAIKRNKKDFHFVWIGGNPANPGLLQANIELRNMGIADLVSIIPESDNAEQYIAAANLFFLPSRQDPYPLVVLEAAAQQIPCICFDKAGGIVEFVEEDAGWILPYMDLVAVADCMDHLMEHRQEIQIKGKKAAEKLVLRHNSNLLTDQLQKIPYLQLK